MFLSTSYFAYSWTLQNYPRFLKYLYQTFFIKYFIDFDIIDTIKSSEKH